MPGNVGTALPISVLPRSLCLSFTESRERLELRNNYHDATIHRRRLVGTSRKRFKFAKKLTPSQLAELKDFYDDHEGGLIAFYFYNPFDVNEGLEIGSNWDADGIEEQGRHVVVFHGDWQQSSNPARSEVPNIELVELSDGDAADDELIAVELGESLGDVVSAVLTIWSSRTPNSEDSSTHGTPNCTTNLAPVYDHANAPTGGSLVSATTSFPVDTDLSAFAVSFQMIYSGATIHLGDPASPDLFTPESWNIYDAYFDVEYASGPTLRFRAATAVGNDNGFSSGQVLDEDKANDADAATPITYAKVQRWHFSNLSDPAILTLSNFTTLA